MTDKRTHPSFPPDKLEEGVHFYFNEDGLMVFTENYHLQRGYCCKNGCRHCPWKSKKATENE